MNNSIDKKMMNTLEKHLKLTNDFLAHHAEITKPDNLEPEEFLNLALSAPAMIAADIIKRLAGTFGKTEKQMYDMFRITLKQGLGLIENRKKDTKAVSKKSGK